MTNTVNFPEVRKGLTISDLKAGQGFIYQHLNTSERELWLKTDATGASYNAVRIVDGCRGMFYDYNTGLIPVDLEINAKVQP